MYIYLYFQKLMKNAEELAAEMTTQQTSYTVITTREMQVERQIHLLSLGQEYLNSHMIFIKLIENTPSTKKTKQAN